MLTRPSPIPTHGERRALLSWSGLVVLGLVVCWGAVRLHLRVGTASPPFTGSYRWMLVPATLLAPAVAILILWGVRAGLLVTLGWRTLLALGYLSAFSWTVALALVDGSSGIAGPVTNPQEYLADVPSVGDDPIGWVHTFVANSLSHTIATRTHPPAPVLALWSLGKAGIHRPVLIGLIIVAIGCGVVPLVAVAARSLCGELAARRLLPVLALAPYAVWVGVSMDAVTATLCAGGIVCGVIASEQQRRGWNQVLWGALAGLLLSFGSLFSYAVAWLGATLVATYFVRRRPLLNLVTAFAALLPLALFRIWGFVWPNGLTAAQKDFSLRVEPARSWLLWVALDLLVLIIACGPSVFTAGRRIRLTPGWPFLVGALLAIGFALGSGLSRGEVERSWLPYYPWLLVAALAPAVRPTPGDPPEAAAGAFPHWQVLVGAVAAITVQAVLRTSW